MRELKVEKKTKDGLEETDLPHERGHLAGHGSGRHWRAASFANMRRCSMTDVGGIVALCVSCYIISIAPPEVVASHCLGIYIYILLCECVYICRYVSVYVYIALVRVVVLLFQNTRYRYRYTKK